MAQLTVSVISVTPILHANMMYENEIFVMDVIINIIAFTPILQAFKETMAKFDYTLERERYPEDHKSDYCSSSFQAQPPPFFSSFFLFFSPYRSLTMSSKVKFILVYSRRAAFHHPPLWS